MVQRCGGKVKVCEGVCRCEQVWKNRQYACVHTYLYMKGKLQIEPQK